MVMGISLASVASSLCQPSATSQAQQRQQAFQQLGAALQSGDIAGAQKAFAALEQYKTAAAAANGTAATNGATSSPISQMAQALQSGDIKAAQSAFSQLMALLRQQDHQHANNVNQNTSTTTANTSGSNGTSISSVSTAGGSVNFSI